MKLIGLTGGIASGKSTVSGMFAALGCPVIDADRIAREVVERGTPALSEIARRWPEVIRPDGTLDRAGLGSQVFADVATRDELDAMIMPKILERTGEISAALERSGARIALYDAALIVEKGLDRVLDGLIVVTVPDAAQIARMKLRDGFSESEARARIASQLPLAEKVRRATWVIDNAGTLEDTRRQVERIWDELKRLT
jgi:dephospho-CoA kinase